MTSRDEWSDYLRWSDAIAAEFFGGRNADRPVYLDLEDDVCARVAAEAGYEGGNPRQAIFDAVGPTLTVASDGEGTFTGHVQRLRAWRVWGGEDWPPYVGALAFLSLVAEEMASSEDFSSANYYGRLLRHLGEDPMDGRLRHKLVRDFARQSHELWDALNDWLLEDPETRGYPTAFSFDYRAHIGRAMSQALLREGDRAELLELFVAWRLVPGNEVAPTDMRRLLLDAFEVGGFSETLRRIASDPEALDRISEVACAELSAWKGDSTQATVARSDLWFIGARRSRPTPTLIVSPVVSNGELAENVEISLLREGGEEQWVGRGFVGPPDESGARKIEDGPSLADMLVTSVVIIDGKHRVARRPRSMLLLERNSEASRLEEVGRAQLGGEYLVIVREGLGSRVREMLEESGRPGWSLRTPEELRGLPAGWLAFVDVHLMAVPMTKHADLASLIPVGWTKLSVTGGLHLPGQRSFLVDRPPEIAASVIEDEYVHASILRAEDESPTELGEVDGAAAWNLADLGLAAGMHRVMLSDEDDRVLTSERIRLYEPDSPLERPVDREFGHVLYGEGLGALFASRKGEPDCRGAMLLEVAEDPTTQPGVDLPTQLDQQAEQGADSPSPQPRVAEETSADIQPASCIETGAHRMREVEGELVPARAKEKPWRCVNCGLERYFPTSLRRRRGGARGTRGEALQAAAIEMPALSAREDGASQSDLVQALCTIRSGSWGDFVRLVAQRDDRPWAAHELGRLYSAVGLIDVECSPTTLQPVSWQVAPPVLVHVEGGFGYLAGWRSVSLLEELSELSAMEAGRLTVRGGVEQFPRIEIKGLDRESLQSLADVSEAASNIGGLAFMSQSGEHIAGRLPALSEVRDRLPRGPLPDDGIESYDLQTGGWGLATGARAGGVFRGRRGAWRWWHVNRERDVRVVDSRLGKWLAAAELNEPMLAYRPEEAMLLAHAGSPLPGLYERAAVLCSGIPPIDLDGRLIGYADVPPEVAASLVNSLSG